MIAVISLISREARPRESFRSWSAAIWRRFGCEFQKWKRAQRSVAAVSDRLKPFRAGFTYFKFSSRYQQFSEINASTQLFDKSRLTTEPA